MRVSGRTRWARKMLYFLLAAVCGLAVVLAGCTAKQESAGGNAAESQGNETTTTPATATETSTDAGEEPGDSNFNATGYPIVKEKITLQMYAAYWDGYGYLDFKDMELFRRLEEKTNIHIEWKTVPVAAYNDQLSLLLSSNDLPDAFFSDSAGVVGDPNVIKYSSQGMFLKLNDLVDKYAPNLQAAMEKRPELRSLIQFPDGGIYALPHYREDPNTIVYNKAYINQTWLDKLGLDVPETIDEFNEVLRQFKSGDPNGNGKADEIPFTFLADQFQKGPYGFFGAFGTPYSYGQLVEFDGAGKAWVPQMSEGYRAGVRWLSQLYAEGLIDTEAFTHTNVQYQGKGKLDPGVIGVYMDFAGTNMVGEDKFADYAVLKPLKGPDGIQQWPGKTKAFIRGHFVITDKNPYPEATVRWADEFYNELMMLEFESGPIGIVLNDNGDGTFSKNAPPEGVSEIDFLYTHSPKLTVGFATEETLKKLTPSAYERQQQSEVELFKPYLVEINGGTIALTAEMSEQANQIFTDLEPLVKKKFAEWVTGISDVDRDWDSYIGEMNNIGVAEYVQIMQDAGDAVR